MRSRLRREIRTAKRNPAKASSAQLKHLIVGGIAEAASAVVPKAELPFQVRVEVAPKQQQRVYQVGTQHLDFRRLFAFQVETVGKLDRQQQRGARRAVRADMYPSLFKHDLRTLGRNQSRDRASIDERFGFEEGRVGGDSPLQFPRVDRFKQLRRRESGDVRIG